MSILAKASRVSSRESKGGADLAAGLITLSSLTNLGKKIKMTSIIMTFSKIF